MGKPEEEQVWANYKVQMQTWFHVPVRHRSEDAKVVGQRSQEFGTRHVKANVCGIIDGSLNPMGMNVSVQTEDTERWKQDTGLCFEEIHQLQVGKCH